MGRLRARGPGGDGRRAGVGAAAYAARADAAGSPGRAAAVVAGAARRTRVQPPGETGQARLVDGVAVVVDEERRQAGLAAKLRFGDQGRPAPARRHGDDAVHGLRAPREQRPADGGDGLAERIGRDHTAGLTVHLAHVVPERPWVVGAHRLHEAADDVLHGAQREFLLRQLLEAHAVLDLAELQQLEEGAVGLEDGAQPLVGELALQVVVAPLVHAQVEVAAEVHVAQLAGGGPGGGASTVAAGRLAQQVLDLRAEREGSRDVAGRAPVGARPLEQSHQPRRVLRKQRVGVTAQTLRGEVVEAQHVEQVDGHQGDPDDGHHAHVGGDHAEVGDLDAVAKADALQGHLLRIREEVGPARLKAVAGAEEESPATLELPGLALEEAGETAPDELVGQALLAGAGGAGGAQRQSIRRADERRVVAGAAHGGGQVLAQAAAHVAEVEAVVAAVQAVRQRPVEALQARLQKSRGRPVDFAGRRALAAPVRRPPRAHAVQERLDARHVAGLAAVPVALQHGVRPVVHEVGEQVLDHRVGAAPVGAEQQRVHVAGHGAGRGGAQRLAGARPVHATQARHVRQAPGSSPPAAAGRRWPRRARGCRRRAPRRG